MAIAVIATSGSGAWEDGSTITLTKSGTQNVFVSSVWGRLAVASPTQSLDTHTLNGVNLTTLSTVIESALGTQDFYQTTGVIYDGDIPETLSTYAIGWTPNSFDQDGQGIGLHLSGVDQTNTYYDQTATSGVQFATFQNVSSTGNLTFSGSEGGIAIYVQANNARNPSSAPAGWTEVGSTTNDTLMDFTRTYYKLLTADTTDETVSLTFTGNGATGVHFVEVLNADIGGGSGDTALDGDIVSVSSITGDLTTGSVVPGPVITQPPHATVSKGSTFSYTPALTSGTSGLWFLEFGPDAMTIDPETGELSWNTTSLPRGQGVRVTIGHSNTGGEDLKTFVIHVDETGTSELILMNGAVDTAGGTTTTTATTLRAAATEISSGDTLVVVGGSLWASTTSQNSGENTWDTQNLDTLPTGLSNQHTTIISEGYTIIDSGPHDAIARDDKGLESGAGNTGEYYKFSGMEWTGSNRGPILFRANGTLLEFCGGTDGSYAVTPTTQAEADAAFANVAGTYIGGNSTAENCFGFGDARYIFQSGNFTSDCSFNRCIARPDEYNGTNPRGGIIHYSVDNSGTFSSYVIDGDQEDKSPFYNNYAGSFGLPATGNETHAQSQLMRGCAAINVDMNPILNDSNSGSNTLTIEDFVLLDTTNTVTPWTGATSLLGIQSDSVVNIDRFAMSETHRWDFSTSSGGIFLAASSGSNIDGAIFDRLGWDGVSATIDIADLVGSEITIDNANIYDFKGSVDAPGSSTPTTNTTTYNPRDNGWDYPTRAEEGSPIGVLAQAPDLTQFAAPNLHLPTDTGWNIATSKWAWPHPEEQHIASRMRTYSKTNIPVRHASTGTNPTDFTGAVDGGRGFAAATESFSEYIWGQFGRTVPPLRVDAKSTADGEVTFWIGKYRSSRGDTITKFNIYDKTDLVNPIAAITDGSLTATVTGISGGSHDYVIRAVDATQTAAYGNNEAGESGDSRTITLSVTEAPSIVPVTILNTAIGVGDNDQNPITPSAGVGDRYWVIAVQREGAWANIPSDITISGTTPTVMPLLFSNQTATMKVALYGVGEQGIGTNPDATNGSITYNADGDTPAGASIITTSIVLDNVDQTTPFTLTEGIGYASQSQDNTQNCTFVLNEIEGGMGVAFLSCSKTGTTWDLTDNGYAANGTGQWTQSTNTSGNCATKSISTTASAVSTTLTTGLATDKVGTLAVMFNPTDNGPDTVPDAFDFTDQTNVLPTQIVTSNTVTITGIEAASDLTITGGEYSIDGGAFASTPTTISNGQTLQLRATASMFGSATITVTVDIGTVIENWYITTEGDTNLTQLVENYSTSGSTLTYGHGATNTSGATYKEDSGEVAVVRNGTGLMYIYALGDYTNIIKTITLNFDGSDVEGVVDMGGGEFATCSEDGGRYQIDIYDWPAANSGDVTVNSKQRLTLALAGTDNNSGAEGIAYDRVNQIFYVVGEGQQDNTDRRFFRIERPGVAGRFGDTSSTYSYNGADDGDGWSLDDYISEPFNPEVAFASLGATGAAFDLSDADFDHTTGNVIICSHTGSAVIQVDVTDGTIVSQLDCTGFTQIEIVAILPNGEMMVGGEDSEYKIYTANVPAANFDGDVQGVSTITGAITANIRFNSNVFAQSTVAGSLTTGINLNATSTSVSEVLGILSSGIRFEGDTSSTVGVTGSLDTNISLQGDIVGQSEITSELTTGINLTGDVVVVPQVTSSLTAGAGLIGDITVTPETSGDLSTAINLSGDIVCQAEVSSSIDTQITLAGDVVNRSSVSGELEAAFLALEGAISSIATVVGDLTNKITLSGDILSVATVAGILDVPGDTSLDGQITAQAEVSGDLITGINLSGSTGAEGETSGEITTRINLSGDIASIAQVGTSSLDTGISLSGSIVVEPSVTGIMLNDTALQGQITVTSDVQGSLSVKAYLSGDVLVENTTSGDLDTRIALGAQVNCVCITRGRVLGTGEGRINEVFNLESDYHADGVSRILNDLVKGLEENLGNLYLRPIKSGGDFQGERIYDTINEIDLVLGGTGTLLPHMSDYHRENVSAELIRLIRIANATIL